jgi:hypothetical protein
MERGMKYGDRKANLEFFQINNGSSKFRELFTAAQDRWQRLQRLEGKRTKAEDGDGSQDFLDLFKQ